MILNIKVFIQRKIRLELYLNINLNIRERRRNKKSIKLMSRKMNAKIQNNLILT